MLNKKYAHLGGAYSLNMRIMTEEHRTETY